MHTLISTSGNRYIKVKGWWIFKRYFNFRTNTWSKKAEFENNRIDHIRDYRR